MANNVVSLRHLDKKAPHSKARGLMDFSELTEELMGNCAFRDALDEQNAVVMSADFIRDTRKKAGLSQSELAERLHVSQARVSALESGSAKRGPSVSLLSRVASACGGSLSLSIDR